MAAKLKVDQIESVDGSANVTLNNSITMASGKTLPAASLTGTVPTASLGTGTAGSGNFLRGDGSWQAAGSTSASDLTSGTLPMARLSGTLPALNGSALTNLPGGGKILQVVETTTSTAKSVGGNTYTGTNLVGSITPSATSSRILVMVNQSVVVRTDTTDEREVFLELRRGSTVILTNKFPAAGESGNRHYDSGFSGSKVDSPNTTSSTTYETFFKIDGSSADGLVQFDGGTSTLILMEIGA
jgi:hypothetical protein